MAFWSTRVCIYIYIYIYIFYCPHVYFMVQGNRAISDWYSIISTGNKKKQNYFQNHVVKDYWTKTMCIYIYIHIYIYIDATCTMTKHYIDPFMSWLIHDKHAWEKLYRKFSFKGLELSVMPLPGACPTKGISIAFEIRSTFGWLWFEICSADHNEI